MIVKTSLISATSSSTKCYWSKGSGRVFCHEGGVVPGAIGYHSRFRCLDHCRLTNHKAKTNQGEISGDNHEPLVVKPHQAWVGKYCLLDISKCLLSIIRPVWCHYLGVFVLGGELAQRRNAQLKVVHIHVVELRKSSEFCHIAHDFQSWPGGE
jgi:hypothetical protein